MNLTVSETSFINISFMLYISLTEKKTSPIVYLTLSNWCVKHGSLVHPTRLTGSSNTAHWFI